MEAAAEEVDLWLCLDSADPAERFRTISEQGIREFRGDCIRARGSQPEFIQSDPKTAACYRAGQRREWPLFVI